MYVMDMNFYQSLKMQYYCNDVALYKYKCLQRSHFPFQVRENEELTSICDELIAKVGS
jgi:hypothetical protein